jgi:transcription antitermination factor NusG
VSGTQEGGILIQAETSNMEGRAILTGRAAGESPCWYAMYTRSRHEKRVREQCERRSIESFLPLYETVHRWKDRRMRVQLPLFSSYVFVRIELIHRLDVLQIPGVVRLVGFNGQPTALNEEEIEALQKGLSGGICTKPHPYLTSGRRVRIKDGPLAGMEGILLRRKGNLRVVISISLLQRSIAVDADLADLEPVSERNEPAICKTEFAA